MSLFNSKQQASIIHQCFERGGTAGIWWLMNATGQFFHQSVRLEGRLYSKAEVADSASADAGHLLHSGSTASSRCGVQPALPLAVSICPDLETTDCHFAPPFGLFYVCHLDSFKGKNPQPLWACVQQHLFPLPGTGEAAMAKIIPQLSPGSSAGTSCFFESVDDLLFDDITVGSCNALGTW